jgi:hypothetical protein
VLFAVCSDRGAPGSTTVALALAAARGLPSVVVEADPYGGDLALRCRAEGDPLPPTPTVLGLGAGRAERRPPRGPLAETDGQPRRLDLWRDGSHQLNDMVRVVPGFLTAEQGSSLAWASVAATVESQLVPVFADLGRIHTGSPSLPVAAAADLLITVCRGDVASVQHMIWRLEQLVPAIAERNGRPPIVMPVVVATRRNGARAASQVAELLAETSVCPTLRGAGWLAWDPSGVSRLQDGANPWAKPLRGSPLMTSARKVIWMLGLATGLDHTDPSAARMRGRRSRDLDPHAGGEAVAPWMTAEVDGNAGRVPSRAVHEAAPASTPAGSAGSMNGHAAANAAAPSFAGLRRLGRPMRVAAPIEDED